MTAAVLTVADDTEGATAALLARYGIDVTVVPDGADIPGSYWGAPEAGVRGRRVYVRADTPIHSLLHEASHVVCMSAERRAALDTDAGGDDLEEAAVCYLQIVLADELGFVGRRRLMLDMDRWGYSFRLGSTNRWFSEDAEDARGWLESQGLLGARGEPRWVLRR
ncbi:MAG: hypothetical protein QNJ00_12625 [Woeseiaceae bacterium]|nr:hypothetical protein [Woeseiaceae bacterium]